MEEEVVEGERTVAMRKGRFGKGRVGWKSVRKKMSGEWTGEDGRKGAVWH